MIFEGISDLRGIVILVLVASIYEKNEKIRVRKPRPGGDFGGTTYIVNGLLRARSGLSSVSIWTAIEMVRACQRLGRAEGRDSARKSLKRCGSRVL